MKIDISLAIFKDESQVTLDGPAKEWILSDEDVPVDKEGSKKMAVWWYGLSLSTKRR